MIPVRCSEKAPLPIEVLATVHLVKGKRINIDRALESIFDAIAADSLGMEHYGPASAPLADGRDMYQEAIEELLDAIYYLTRQVARLEDQRRKLAASGGDER